MTAPAQFRRITPETEIAVPCVLAHCDESGFYWAMVIYTKQEAKRLRIKYTHWLPIQWPEVRG